MNPLGILTPEGVEDAIVEIDKQIGDLEHDLAMEKGLLIAERATLAGKSGSCCRSSSSFSDGSCGRRSCSGSSNSSAHGLAKLTPPSGQRGPSRGCGPDPAAAGRWCRLLLRVEAADDARPPSENR